MNSAKEFFLFNRLHHQRISGILNKINTDLFSESGCYFAGGTAIALLLGEYRESVDIDFLCSKESFKQMRELAGTGIQAYFKEPVVLLREPRIDQYGIRFLLDLKDGLKPIKFEVIHEGYLPELRAHKHDICGVKTLHQEDLMACKIMSTSDRGLDKATKSRDIIDLIMLSHSYGGISERVILKVETNYGTFSSRLVQAKKILENVEHRNLCFKDLDVSEQAQYLVKNLAEKKDQDVLPSLRSGAFEVNTETEEGSTFSLMPESGNRSPLDIQGIKTDLSTKEILSYLRESRKD